MEKNLRNYITEILIIVVLFHKALLQTHNLKEHAVVQDVTCAADNETAANSSAPETPSARSPTTPTFLGFNLSSMSEQEIWFSNETHPNVCLESAQTFQERRCLYISRCRNDQRVEIPSIKCQELVCFPCSPKRPECDTDNIFCPGVPDADFHNIYGEDCENVDQGYCVLINCSPGKVLSGGNCTSAPSEISGLGYQVRLWYVPASDNATVGSFVTETPASGLVLKKFYSKIFSVIGPLVQDFELSFGAYVNISELLESQHSRNRSRIGQGFLGCIPAETTNDTTGKEVRKYDFQTPFLYWITGYLTARGNISRDEFEQTMIDKLLHGNIEIDFAEGIAVNFTPVMMWSQSDAADFCTEREEDDADIKCYNDSVTSSEIFSKNRTTDFKDKCLNLTSTLTCSFIRFHAPTYIVEINMTDFRPTTIVIVDLNVTIITFSCEHDLHKMSVEENGILFVCRELLEEKLALEIYSIVETEVTEEESYVIIYTCWAISVLCILLSTVTYVIFPVLRSTSGKNNLCVCISLFLTYGSELANYLTDDESTLCIALGITGHFLWMCTYCWTFICCFHMYRVFTSKTRSSHVTSRSQNVLLIKNFVFSLLLPAIIVISVVIIMYVTSAGKDIGYGGSDCYLNSILLIRTAEVGPLTLISFSNLIFFLATVVSIHKVRKLQERHALKKDDFQNVCVYAKLSAVTGVTWSMYFIADATNVDALRMPFTIIDGLHGVFIFFSFTCSRRVLHLYMRYLGLKSLTSARS